jgi:acetyl/propionyl-CoA carboxylase alpha subunit/acetyl-CoA carboxylase carboxyltransferase component
MEIRPIRRLAVMNRGEAALRCIRAVKALRIREGSALQVLAIHTPVDRHAPFVRHADGAVELPVPAGPVAAYLDHGLVLDALRRLEADAVWPGWGFLSEDPVFVERVAEQGLVFLGPSADVMRSLGDKIAAKRLAENLGCPVSAWSGEAVASAEQARAVAEAIGFPVVVKAAAGGGGRGIRSVDEPAGIDEAFRSAQAEATAAFGDERIFIERKVRCGRHVEVQIAADRHGQVLSLGCRDCSVQRRHQKVIEETPPPDLSDALLDDLEASAVGIAAKVGYCGVATVEFLVEGDDYFFLEVNPRLQVEHAITEVVAGVDLVELQIRIARGERLPERGWPRSGVAIEARVCAEDPDAGFLPAPGRVARFDPALGPGVRVDAGVVAGSVVPAEFDSLLAKVIARGEDREEACARLASALADLELVIEGGATNQGFLLRLLEDPDFRAGGVDTGWLDRRPNGPATENAVEALVTAAILAYQRARAAERLNFYADPGAASVGQVPASEGQELDLSHRGEAYRLQVYAIGAWTYRIHLDGRVVTVRLLEDGPGGARLELAGRSLRVLHDAGDAGLRIDVEGRPHRFEWQAAGRVRAGAPAVVVALHVEPGDRVEAGRPVAVLEAMKMEIAVEAPVAGVVQEVCARRGQQVAAGDLLLVIEPDEAASAAGNGGVRLVLPEQDDPLSLFFLAEGRLDLRGVEGQPPGRRHAAVRAVGEEMRRVLLGFDADPERIEQLLAFLEAPLPEGLSAGFRAQLALVRREVAVFADVDELFLRAPRASVSGAPGPSNAARTRMFVRRMRAAGAGVAPEHLELLQRALSHYGVVGLDASAELERATLRLFASQRASAVRHRMGMAILRRLAALAGSGIALGRDDVLRAALVRIAGMRGHVPDALADLAADLRHLLFDGPEIERRVESGTARLERWLEAADEGATEIPEQILLEIADVPRRVFDRVGRWLDDPDRRRRALALGAQLRRLYTPRVPSGLGLPGSADDPMELLALDDGRVVLGTAARCDSVAAAARELCARAESARDADGASGVDALEVVVPLEDDALLPRLEDQLLALLEQRFPAERLTLTVVCPGAPDVHRTWRRTASGPRPGDALHGLHPEAAQRVDLARLERFALERLPGAEDVYVFHGRSRELPDDERIFVLAEVRGRHAGGDDRATGERWIPAFERSFHEAARTLRKTLAERDERRRLQWNRIAVFVAPEVMVRPELARRLSVDLFPATRHLGLDRVVVRLRLVDPEAPDAPARDREVVIADPTGSRIDIAWREPRRAALEPASDYERRLVEARRRGLVYPYEIVRMLTGGGVGREGGPAERGFAPGAFEEYDLDPAVRRPRALRVAERPYGQNASAVVFGVVSTPTDSVPEGMRRVLILSDPTIGMGSLAAPECDRIVAAIDLAETLGVPVEWVPVSSGARISMDSGTENLDATARVVRRIVTFTRQGGVIHLVVHGVNVGAQSYWNALATMLMHTRGALVMTPGASMVLTGRAALEASGSVAAEDEVAIGGFERVMGPNGEAQYYATSLGEAFRILHQHHRYTYVVPGEAGPRPSVSSDAVDRDVCASPCLPEDGGDFASVGEIFDEASNPDRKRPFPMRALMRAVIDADGGHLERWGAWVGSETAVVWDACLGGRPVCLIGIEGRNLPRHGYRPSDGPESWTGGTLFPLSSRKVARALNAASGNRPAVILANLSGFDGSPESMRKLQLEYGAEIARAVVEFQGPLVFLVVSRYHGGAYVVFSRELNPGLRAAALEGSFASVIGGAPAAKVVFAREARARASADSRLAALTGVARERAFQEILLEKQAEIAQEFDAVHTVERAQRVGSLERIVAPARMRPYLLAALQGEAGDDDELTKFRD